MGRTATGSPQWHEGGEVPHWKARISLPDGRRPWLHFIDRATGKPRFTDPTEKGKARAGEAALGRVERIDEPIPSSTPVLVGETVSTYSVRWIKSRVGKVADTRDNAGQLRDYILPTLGPLAMTAVTAADIEGVVGLLDSTVERGDIGTKTARNIWGTLSKMFDDATHAKPKTGLKILDVNPCSGVRGPDDDAADKALQFLYPSEVVQFLEAPIVPLTWKRNTAIAIYLCLRDAEQRALKWDAVDLKHGMITISETYDRRKKVDKEGTKSGATRSVPIHPRLLPLLEAMHEESGGTGYVCSMPSLRDMAEGLRRWLKNAGVGRTELHKSTPLNKAMRWHDTRATGLTWFAVEGRSSSEIRDIAGHTQTSMTDRYMRAAGLLRGGRFGEPFPTLPGDIVSDIVPGHSNYAKQLRGGRDSNPRPPA